MGDRANVVVETRPGGRVFFYTHWGGHAVPERVQTALRRKMRWQDPSYLARIVFDALVAGQHDQETGYGIDVTFGDNGYDVLLLRPKKGVVELHTFDFEKWDVVGNWEKPVLTMTFDEFCKLDNISWDTLVELTNAAAG